jgi:hypothetical protein
LSLIKLFQTGLKKSLTALELALDTLKEYENRHNKHNSQAGFKKNLGCRPGHVPGSCNLLREVISSNPYKIFQPIPFDISAFYDFDI